MATEAEWSERYKSQAKECLEWKHRAEALVKALEEIIDIDTAVSDGGKVHDHGFSAEIAIKALHAVVSGVKEP